MAYKMKFTLHDRFLQRELGERSRYSKIKGIYGDKRWVKDLDIVNELDGHSGCVNALSWSKSGALLASGSDDQHVNIHTYQSDSSNTPFRLATTISTGHSANIFSVKFMPHSNDRTIVTAAGDRQIRVFDIEHSGRSTVPSSASSASRSSRRQGFLSNGVHYLTDGDTNTRVYQSHSDRVKKIVTESSPYLFLSCSEDGEVRQWDLRLPSSAYPKARELRVWGSGPVEDEDGVPPALISYKRWHLDINSISCSPSQPHYIALGGAHLHCFLHDRRMLGRDQRFERGSSISSSGYSEHDDNAMGEATQCVKRFAPNGQRKMRRTQNGHITACKISDANPNEMVVSWSGDWIYNFDLLRSPDARENTRESHGTKPGQYETNRNRQSHDRKRKRTKQGSSNSQEGSRRASSKPRRTPLQTPNVTEDVALRVNYENGQSENIPIRGAPTETPSVEGAELLLSATDRRSYRIAKTSVNIRKHMFSLGNAKQPSDQDPTGYAASFTSVLGFSASITDDMDDIMGTWRYPLEPDEFEIELQKTLRRNRESARRFIQASGTVARLLGGKLRTAGSPERPMISLFARVELAHNESKIEDSSEQFSYDFLKAIVLWLDSGPGALIEGFTPPTGRYKNHPRFPISEGEGIDAIDETLIPYLLNLAGDRPVPDVDSSRFEIDENRKLFESERRAVIAFASAIKIPFEDLSRTMILDSNTDGYAGIQRAAAQDRKAAQRFWGFRVARGILLNAGEGVNFAFIDRAFGGSGRSSIHVLREEQVLSERLGHIDPDEKDSLVESVGLRDAAAGSSRTCTVSEGVVSEELPDTSLGEGGGDLSNQSSTEVEEEGSDEEMIPIEDLRAVVAEAGRTGEDVETVDDESADDEGENGEEDDREDDTNNENSSDDGVEEDDGGVRHFLFRSAFERSAMREQVHRNVPCATHTRRYRGHCNVRTVKDVNFFGLEDEYVVSGSDSGHLFIWDRRSAELVNILEGDGETVNVIQGHPYEPMLAVSGIDHTIKIFSPDRRARRNALHGIGVAAVDPSDFSSLNFGRRGFGTRRPRRSLPTDGAAAGPVDTETGRAEESDDAEMEPPPAATGLASKKRMHLEYQITSQNNLDRQGGNQDAYLSRATLAQLAARVRMQRVQARVNQQGGGAGGEEAEDVGHGVGEGEGVALPMVVMGPDGRPSIVMDSDNCSLM